RILTDYTLINPDCQANNCKIWDGGYSTVPGVGVGPGGRRRRAGEGVVVEGDTLDYGVDLAARGEAEGLDRAPGQPGDQWLAGAIEPHLDNRPLGRADLGDRTRQYVEGAEPGGRLERDHHVAGADAHPQLGAEPHVDIGHAQIAGG